VANLQEQPPPPLIPNAYKLLASYSRKDVDILTKYCDVTQIKGKQVSIKT